MRLHSLPRRNSSLVSILVCGVAVFGFACAPSPTPQTSQATPNSTQSRPEGTATPASAKAAVIPGKWKLVSFGAPW